MDGLAIELVYEAGVLRPLEPLDLRERQLVNLTITDEAPAEPWLDTDYLAGIEAPDLDGTKRLGLLVEVQRTGRSSQEHSTFTTGMTNLGRTLGSPLGPDTLSAFAQGRFDTDAASFAPWVEVARLSSDVYTATESGPVVRIRKGPAEKRLRGGIQASAPLRERVLLRVEGFAERVFTAGFDPATAAFNAGVMASLVWLGPGPVLQ